MGYADRIKPISYVKANAAEIIADLAAGAEPMIVTQNGEAKAVLIDIAAYDRMQETMAMLKIVAMGQRDLREGRIKPAREVIEDLLAKHAERQ